MSFIFIGLLLIGGWLAATELVETERKYLTETQTLTKTKTSSRRNKKFGRDFFKICENLEIISVNGRLMEKQNEGWTDDLRMWNLGWVFLKFSSRAGIFLENL